MAVRANWARGARGGSPCPTRAERRGESRAAGGRQTRRQLPAALGAAGWRNGSVRRTAPSGGRRGRNGPGVHRRVARRRQRSRGGCGTCHGTQYRMLRSASAGTARQISPALNVEAPGLGVFAALDVDTAKTSATGKTSTDAGCGLPWAQPAVETVRCNRRRYRPIDKPGSQRRGTGASVLRLSTKRHRKATEGSHRRWKRAALGAAGWRNGSAQQTPVSPDR